MCGELEDEEHSLESGYRHDKFLRDAQDFLSLCREEDGASGLSAYMDRVFAGVLSSCLQDMEAAADKDRSELLLAQPVVFARLAGFLAGHVALSEDPLRQVVDALLAGYGEAQGRSVRAHPRGHFHPHDYDY